MNLTSNKISNGHKVTQKCESEVRVVTS